MKPEIKKLLILNLPYLLFVWLFDKVGAAVRLSPGADASAKLLHLGDGFTAAFSSNVIFPDFLFQLPIVGVKGFFLRLKGFILRLQRGEVRELRNARRFQ